MAETGRGSGLAKIVALAFLAPLIVLGLWGVAPSPAGHTEKYSWVQVTPSANWKPGYWFSALVFRNKLWVFGHEENNWNSEDGKNWAKAPTLENLPTGFNTFVVFNGQVYAIGGAKDGFQPGEKGVWKTADGNNWTVVSANPEWTARAWHATLAYDGKIWLLGGYDGTYKSDVWYSTDGAHWKLATAKAPWEGRCMHSSAVFDGRIWVLGGRRNMESWLEKDFNDVWYSRDGADWTRATTSAAWSKRYGQSAVEWRGRLWVMGGSRLFRNNEVWFSGDGARWVKAGEAPWSPRVAAASVVFQDRVWLMGGKEGGGRFKSDVWYMASRD